MSEVQGTWMQFLINSIRSEVENGSSTPASTTTMEAEAPPPQSPAPSPSALHPGTWCCLVCSRPHNSILVLPCQHKFCERCLHLWVGIYIDMYHGHGGEFPCQVCWAVFPVPSDGLAVYAQDYQVRLLQESFGGISMETEQAVTMETPAAAPAQEMMMMEGGRAQEPPGGGGQREGAALPTPGTAIMCHPGYCYAGYKSQACQLPHHLM